MKRLLLVSQVLVFLAVSAPRRADADFTTIFDWIQELSGPGPFSGVALQQDVVCFDTPLVAPGALPINSPAGNGGSQVSSGPLERVEKAVKRCFLPFNKNMPRQRLGVMTSRLTTGANPYSYGADKSSVSKDVHAYGLGFTANTTLPHVPNRLLEVGIATGGIRFTGASLNRAFWVYQFDAPVVTIKPLWFFANSDNPRWTPRDILKVQLVTRVVGRVTSGDFGAMAGQNSSVHVSEVLFFGAVFDFGDSEPFGFQTYFRTRHK